MPLAEINILYVDDDMDDVFLLRSILSKLRKKYILDNASTYEEAISKIDNPYDIFLVDYRLGKTNGLDLLKKIKSVRRFAPVIILTGMEDVELDNTAFAEGASDYLIKGNFSPEELERAIRYAIRDARSIEATETNAKRFRIIFERSADPIALINKKGYIINSNPVFNKVFNYEYNNTDEVKFTSFVADTESINKIEAALEQDVDLTDLEMNLYKEAPKTLNAMVNLVLHDADSGVYQVMIKDLTTLREKEEEIRSRKFQATGRIARILAHEIKNPLTNITLSAEQIRSELPDEVIHESGELIEVIERNTKRINELITQLLNATKFSELTLAPTDLKELVEDVLQQAADSLRLKQIKLINKNNLQNVILELDSEKIKIALFNLVVNAIDVMEQGKGILTINTYENDEKYFIEIRDNGPGMSKEQMERLFEPFFSNKLNGTGLGLTNTQNIMLNHGGKVKVKSLPGKGTSFFMIFNKN